jgi:hypothetical protein
LVLRDNLDLRLLLPRAAVSADSLGNFPLGHFADIVAGLLQGAP